MGSLVRGIWRLRQSEAERRVREAQSSGDSCFSCQFICSVIYHSGMSAMTTAYTKGSLRNFAHFYPKLSPCGDRYRHSRSALAQNHPRRQKQKHNETLPAVTRSQPIFLATFVWFWCGSDGNRIEEACRPEKMCIYFILRILLACSVNIYSKGFCFILYFIKFELLRAQPLSFAFYQWAALAFDIFDTFATYSSLVRGVTVETDRWTQNGSTADLNFSTIKHRSFSNAIRNLMNNCCVSTFYSSLIDRARDETSPRFPFKKGGDVRGGGRGGCCCMDLSCSLAKTASADKRVISLV